MTTTELAVNESLAELRRSLQQDQQMIRNYRTALVKARELDRLTFLKDIEERIESLVQALDTTTGQNR